ncbi:MAG: hypothetical protein ACU84Q_13475 [Gammaproteobacteria bacterium]
MNIQDLGSLGELLAAIATVATLGYLAYQIRLNTLHSRAFTQRDVLREITNHYADVTKLPDLVRRGLTNFDNLQDDEKVEFSGMMLPKAAQFEATLRLHRAGLIDHDLFIAHRAWIRSWLTSPGGNEWWRLTRDSFSADVRVFIDEAIENKTDLPRPITEAMPFFISENISGAS